MAGRGKRQQSKRARELTAAGAVRIDDRPYCTYSGKRKRKFKDRLAAILADTSNGGGAYLCTWCGYWHRTRRL